MNFARIAALLLTILTVVADKNKNKKAIPPTKRLHLPKSEPSWTHPKVVSNVAENNPSIVQNDVEHAELLFFSFKINLINRDEMHDKTHFMKHVQRNPYTYHIVEYEEPSNYNMDLVCRNVLSGYDYFGFHGIFYREMSRKVEMKMDEWEAEWECEFESGGEITDVLEEGVSTYLNMNVVPQYYDANKYSHSVLNCHCEYKAELDCTGNHQGGANVCIDGKIYVTNGISTLHGDTRNVNSIFVFKPIAPLTPTDTTEIAVQAYLHETSKSK